jgi:UDP-N-acetylmuramate--alanine ligase
VVYLAGIYGARETPIPGVSSQLIADLLEAKGKAVTYASELDDLAPKVLRELKRGDLFLTAGAGSIDQLGDKVLASLQAQEAARA